MSDLTTFRDHARRMAGALHHDDCGDRYRTALAEWAASGKGDMPEQCPGCIPAADRVLWQQLANEVDTYLGARP